VKPLILLLVGWIVLAPVYGQDVAVTTSPALLQRLVIAPVTAQESTETLRLPARVALNEHRLARIGPSVSGRVADIKAFIGQNVKKGEILALINSTELGNAQAAYLKAHTQVNLHKLAVDRAQRLLQADVISRAELKERESELVEAEVELRANADQLRVMGMTDRSIRHLAASGQLDSVTSVTATLEGTVIERDVFLGQITQPTDDLYTIADLSQVWVVAEAPEQKAYLIEPNGQAEVQIPALPGQRVTGRLFYVSDIVNPTTRTVTVRMEIDNPERKIKPEMLATMIIQKPAVTELGIPAKAVVRTGDQDHVFVRTASDRFALRAVSLAPEQGGFRRVVEGLTAGESIVVDGAFHLNNERIRKELE
jgi:cobalt-zinc-cadmium efflux system membrane fusion protein